MKLMIDISIESNNETENGLKGLLCVVYHNLGVEREYLNQPELAIVAYESGIDIAHSITKSVSVASSEYEAAIGIIKRLTDNVSSLRKSVTQSNHKRSNQHG